MRYDLRMNGKYTPKRNSKARGFTLIELIITMVLLAILILIAIPNFHRISVNGNLKTAARDLIADFSFLKEKAMAENTEFTLTFDVGNNKYTCPGLTNHTPTGENSPANVARDITLNPSIGQVIFRTRGTLDQGGNIVLTNSRGSTATITFNISGRSYVQFNMQ